MTHSTFKIRNSKFALQHYAPFTTKSNFFLAQVVGETMNRCIHISKGKTNFIFSQNK